MKIEELLLKVTSPARYAGGEFNSAVPKKDAPLQFLMCFPDVYEVGMSNLGIKILYGLLNARSDTSCEMCFAPWPDMGALLKQHNLPLFSLTSRTPAKEFDMIGFSLSYELSYTNIPYMLDLAGIPLYAKDRRESDPVIIGGGMCMINPMPVAPFFDLICIGDGEEVLAELADVYTAHKKAGGGKRGFLEKAALIRGVYVPDESIKQAKIRRAAVRDLDKTFFPSGIQIANAEAVHNRAVLELFRGCSRGCRFCQAGFIGRPNRYRKPETLARLTKELIEKTGYEEISLSSLSSCDYPHLKELLALIKPLTDTSGVKISLPSTRVDSFAAEYTESARKGSLTFAPEAGTQRLRDVINKNVTEDDILSSAAAAFKKGFSSVKLYFMVGLPTETDADIDGIIELTKKIKALYKSNASNRKPLSISVSAATFVPKPFTPFQWEKQIPLSEIERIRQKLKNGLRPLGVKFSAHDGGVSQTEAAFARGGKELAGVIEAVYKDGGKFDGWTEFFDYNRFVKAFNSCGLSLEKYSEEIDLKTDLPWDTIDAGISKAFLLKERGQAYKAEISAGCEAKCRQCGIKDFDPDVYSAHCKKGGGAV